MTYQIDALDKRESDKKGIWCIECEMGDQITRRYLSMTPHSEIKGYIFLIVFQEVVSCE